MVRLIPGIRRRFFALTLLVLAAVAFLTPIILAETVPIGDGTEVTDFIQAQPLIDHSRQLQTQIVYLAGEIGMQGRITSLELRGRVGPDLGGTKWTVRMKHTDMPGFIKRWVSDRGKWYKVYEGPPRALPNADGQRFKLDRAFDYDGIRNLLVEIAVEDIAPASSIPLVCSRSSWARTAYRVIGLLPSLPPSGDAGQLAGNYRIMRLAPDIVLGIEPTGSPGQIAASFPFREGFESGTLPGYWETYQYTYGGDTDANLIEVTPQCQPHDGNFHLRMTLTGSAEGAVDAAILTVDLAGRDNVVLKFSQKWFDSVENRQVPCEPGRQVPEVAPLNGVTMSENGRDWVAVAGLTPGPIGDTYTYLEHFVDLDEAARQAGMTFNSHFKIKFQYGITYFACLPPLGATGNCGILCNIDPGMTFDDITIETGNPPPMVAGIIPASAANSGTASITDLSGTGFIHGAGVRLTRGGQPDIIAQNCDVYGSGRITCDIPLEGAAIGPWDVVVTNTADALSGTLVRGFEVTDASVETVTIGDPEDGIVSDAPMGTGCYCRREQAIYQADEIGRGGTIVEIALYADRPPDHDLTDWTIRMKHTGLATYPEDAGWESGVWTVCRRGTLPRGPQGWQTIPLTTPFEYNGIDNLVIDFSFSNPRRGTGGSCRASISGGLQSIGFGESASGCPEHPVDWTGSAPRPERHSARSDIKLTFIR
jgi:hypothetical protein